MFAKQKFRRLAVLAAVCAIVVFCMTYLGLSVAADGSSDKAAGADSFTVTVDGEDTEYDLSDGESAQAYVDGYADNLVNDKGFESHISSALATVRKSVGQYATVWALVPPLVAIVLALITKEVYSSLFVGILIGGMIYSNFSFEGTMVHVFSDGFVGSVADAYNVGIIIFLIMLGAMVAMMNKAGGSAAFGRWATKHIKSRTGAMLATVALGVLIFVDDYFNCLTVGSVMRPVTDKQNVSRAKLAYLTRTTPKTAIFSPPRSKRP